MAMRLAFLKMITIGYKETDLKVVWKNSSSQSQEISMQTIMLIIIIISLIFVIGFVSLLIWCGWHKKRNNNHSLKRVESGMGSGSQTPYVNDERFPLNSGDDEQTEVVMELLNRTRDESSEQLI